MYRKILIATDGTELAHHAVTHGLALAKSVGASVLLVTVTELWSVREVIEAEEGQAGKAVANYEVWAANYAAKVLAAAAEEANAAGVACESRHVKDRHPSEGILEAASQAGCDLIVMATHGRRGIDRLLLGSQAIEVLTYGKVPVLIVR